MLSLRKLTLEDKTWIDPIVMAEHTESADFCFGNMFIWDDEYSQLIGKHDGRLIVKARSNSTPFFAFPIGSGPLRPIMQEFYADAQENGFTMMVAGVTEAHKLQMEEEMPGVFEFTSEERFFDYIYSAEKLATLSGKKLHGKRNHINRFVELYPNWRFEEMTSAHYDDCRALLRQWGDGHDASEGGMIDEEQDAIECALQNFDALGLMGGVLYVNDRLCAFTIGERCAEHTYLVHFEKADAEVEGAYPMINREFVRLIRERYPDIEYINREDDLGLESLRKAKHSYRPEFQVVKYTATLKPGMQP